MPVCKCGELTTEQTCERCQRLIEQELHKIRERMSEALNEGTQYPQEPDELATLRTENERLQSRVAELEAAQTPRRIEDAPRDGTMILAYRKSLKTWGVAYMDGHMWNVSPYGGEWLDDDAFSGWLPLPPATTEATE